MKISAVADLMAKEEEKHYCDKGNLLPESVNRIAVYILPGADGPKGL